MLPVVLSTVVVSRGLLKPLLERPTRAEASGNPPAVEIGRGAPRASSRPLAVMHLEPDPPGPDELLALVAGARTIIRSYLGTAVPARDVPTYAHMWREGRLPVEGLVTSRISLDDVNAGMDDLAAGRALRHVIEITASL